jgi:protein gp37
MFTEKKRYGQDPDVPSRSKTTFNAPLKWKEPKFVFTCSWSDFFIEEADPWREEAYEIMRQTPQHTYQVLTKRISRTLERLPVPKLPNMWLGVSVENCAAKQRIHTLRLRDVAMRFLSIEPLLEDIGTLNLEGIGWVIVGGESGPGARPMHPDWARGIRDQCQDVGVSYFFKQWGEWSPNEPDSFIKVSGNRYSHKTFAWNRAGNAYSALNPTTDSFPSQMVYHVGKKAAGRLLDGRTWDERPVV